MQLREITLHELESAFALVTTHYDTLDYDTFEERIYAMRERYKMFGIFDAKTLLSLAGASLHVNLALGKHLLIEEVVTTDAEHTKQLLSYLEDYAKITGCRYMTTQEPQLGFIQIGEVYAKSV